MEIPDIVIAIIGWMLVLSPLGGDSFLDCQELGSHGDRQGLGGALPLVGLDPRHTSVYPRRCV